MAPVRFPTRSVIAVDVDNTLLIAGVLNQPAVDWIRTLKRTGFFIILWSARGGEYARDFAERFEIAGEFDVIIPKPGYCLDDEGWGWTKYTETIHPAEVIQQPRS